ncbi:MAG: threonine aldolase family protein [Pseudomonadota bacterium]
MERCNFYSDTQTRPSQAMLETVLTAETGDEQSGRDPTTLRLCDRVADLLGHEAAVFMPSGTICNEIAIAAHTRPGDEVICHRLSHIITAEGGGPAAFSGVMMHMLDGENGQFDAADVTGALRSGSRYEPRSRLLSLEQTMNFGGGAVWPLDRFKAVVEAGRSGGLAVHLDGARLMNAVVASGVQASTWGGLCDSVWLDFTKGLGCPVGAVLAGSKDFIDEAWRLKQRWGGAMRQSGVLAAMCLYALDHNVDRLAEDHALAHSIGTRLSALPGIVGVLPVDTNIVIFDLAPDGPEADAVVAKMGEKGIRVGALGRHRMRVVTHLDVDAAQADTLMDAFGELLG